MRLPIFTLLAVSLLTPPAHAADWPHWRGPHRNDVVAESSGYVAGQPWPRRELWKTDQLGHGSSSPLVVGNKLYALGYSGGKDHLVCLDAASGKQLWHVSYNCPEYGRHATGDEGLYSGPSSTPEYDPDSGWLYTLSTDGHLQCWNTARQGERVWGINLYDQYGIGQRPKVGRRGRRDYGYTTSPLLYQNTLIVEVGDDEGLLMGFDKRTGKRRWASQFKGFAGHTGGPALLTVDRVPCVADFSETHLVVARLDQGNEGKTVAEFEWITDFANNIAGVAVHENSVLITSQYNQTAICRLDISLAGGAREVWRQKFASKVCTPLIYKGNVYLVWRRVRCLDFATGKQRWEGGDFSDAGSLIVTADERLIAYGDHGKLALIDTAERSPDKYRVLAEEGNRFRSDAWPHAVLSAGRLYLRDRQGHLVCLQVGNGN